MKNLTTIFTLLLISVFAVTMLTGCPPAPTDEPQPADPNAQVAEPEPPAETPEQPVAVNEPVNIGEPEGLMTSAIPIDKAGLFAWLTDNQYSGWAHDAVVHDVTSPHKRVKIFVNDILAESMSAGNEVHPIGAASVKEVYSGDEHTGWVVEVKTQDNSLEGKGWFWFKADKTDTPETIMVAENGFEMCTGCHVNGKDFVMFTELIQ